MTSIKRLKADGHVDILRCVGIGKPTSELTFYSVIKTMHRNCKTIQRHDRVMRGQNEHVSFYSKPLNSLNQHSECRWLAHLGCTIDVVFVL